jgi:hypoxanthine phosphoribosyltransferase
MKKQNFSLNKLFLNNDYIKEIVISEKAIQTKVKKLAAEINKDYKDTETLIIICVLRGAYHFFTDLVKYIKIPVVLDFISVSSYGTKKTSSGIVRIIKDIKEDIHDKDVLVVEDIIDTGLTYHNLLETLLTRHPKSIKNCILVNKPSKRLVEIEVNYEGYQIEDKFVVGYGLDYMEYFRNLPFIFVPNDEVLNKFGLVLDE